MECNGQKSVVMDGLREKKSASSQARVLRQIEDVNLAWQHML